MDESSRSRPENTAESSAQDPEHRQEVIVMISLKLLSSAGRAIRCGYLDSKSALL